MESRKPSNPKRKRKKKSKPELQNPEELLQNNSSGTILPVTTNIIPAIVTKDITLVISSPISTTPAIPEVTITPPEEDPNQSQELYTPPETNILSQSVNKKKKKKKKPQGVIVAKDEVRPSPVLKYEPPSRRRSIVLQPTVSELEETCEDEVDCASSCIPALKSFSEVNPIIEQTEVNCESKVLSSSIDISCNKNYKSLFEPCLNGTATNSILPKCDLSSPKSVNKDIIIEEELAYGENDSSLVLDTVDYSIGPTLPSLEESNTQSPNSLIGDMPINDKSKMKDIPINKELEELKSGGQAKTKAQLKAERKAAFEAQKGGQISARKSNVAQKSKAELKADRRAVQESQRALKDTKKIETVTVPDDKNNKPPSSDDSTNTVISTKTVVSTKIIMIADPPFKKHAVKVFQEKALGPKKMCLFSHLPQFQWDPSITAELGLAGRNVHPAVIRAGLRMAQSLTAGSDARCVATLAAFVEVIKDYVTPPQKELCRDLDSKLKTQIKFLNKCRPLSVSMTNAIKKLRWNITQIPSSMADDDAKKELTDHIDTFIKEEIILSKRAIANDAANKIHNKDIILIYDCSPLVKQVLTEAQSRGTHFKVIVVDSRPGLGGREMLKYLVAKKIECSYVLINAVSYVMKEVNLVLLDCHSLQANGFVMSRMGSSQIALVAQAYNVPVLVCCETYKFCERVHTDCFVDNELGNPQDLVTSTPVQKCHLQNWKDIPCLSLVNMTYDVTPADLVTAVITEIGMLPCTSVPVVLRVKHLSVPEPSK